MINKDNFIKFLQIHRNRDKFVEALYQLKIDILDIEDGFSDLSSISFNAILTKEGQDWTSWYLWEKPNEEGIHAWDVDNTPIVLDTDEDLWNFLVKNNYLR